MVTKEKIQELTEEYIKNFNGFLVEITASANNKFLVQIDTEQGVSIGQCEEVNRYLNKALDNENNEFELTVSSPGLEKPFRVFEQYRKNINRQVKVRTLDGKEYEALLQDVDQGGVRLSQKVKEIPEGKKKKEWVEKIINLPFDNIKEAKIIITFK